MAPQDESRRDGSRGFRGFVGLMGLVGLALALWALPRVSPVYGIGFALAAGLLESLPVRPRAEVSMSLAPVVTFVALLASGLPVALVAQAGAVVAIVLRRRDRWLERAAVNLGMFTSAAAVSGGVLSVVGGSLGSVHALSSAVGVLGLALAGLAYSLVNALLMAITLKLVAGEGLRTNLGVMGAISLNLALYLPLSAFAAVVMIEVHEATVLLLLVPLLLARESLLGYEAQQRAYDRFLSAFVAAIEAKDPYTRGHAERVGELSEAVATQLGLGYKDRQLARYAALLHDVGKIGVPLSILNKPGKLDEEEFGLIRQHPRTGADLLEGVEFLEPAVDAIRYHHERLDGTGYPYGIDGDEIPYLGRIITVADGFDAMTSTRAYRTARSVEEALRELRRWAGRQFDADVVAALETVVADRQAASEPVDVAVTVAVAAGVGS